MKCFRIQFLTAFNTGMKRSFQRKEVKTEPTRKRKILFLRENRKNQRRKCLWGKYEQSMESNFFESKHILALQGITTRRIFYKAISNDKSLRKKILIWCNSVFRKFAQLPSFIYCPVAWSCRINRLLRCRGVRLPPTPSMSVLYMKLNNLLGRFQ